MTQKFNIVKEPPLHKNQKKIWDTFFSRKYRFIVVNAGRRFGKSTVCQAICAFEAINNGKKVWWVGKTNKDAGEQWRDICRVLDGLWTNKSETDHRLEFYYQLPDGTKSGGEITFRSAEEPENLRGSGLDLLILDEAAFQSQVVWKVLRPSLSDRKGSCIFISTPNGYNWFYEFYQRGIEENHFQFPVWWSRTFTAYDNPYLDPKELDQAKYEMTEVEFGIEYLAQFFDDVGKVFTNVRKCSISEGYDSPIMGGKYSIGIDLARKHDATVVSVVDVATNQQVKLYRYVDKDWDIQKKLMASVIKLWRPQYIYADVTAVGQPVLEDLQKLVEFEINAISLTPTTKPEMIQNLAVKLQNRQIAILDENAELGKLQLDELLAYEYKQSLNKLKWSYGAPQGGRDDTVIALALAIMGIKDKKSQIVMTHNVLYPTKRLDEKIPSRPSIISSYAKKSQELQRAFLKEKGLL